MGQGCFEPLLVVCYLVWLDLVPPLVLHMKRYHTRMALLHAQASITLPDPERPGENLNTTQREGLRQGWNDFRYATTLAQFVSSSRNSKIELDKGLDSMPWNGDVFADRVVTNDKCDIWPGHIAAATEKYMK